MQFVHHETWWKGRARIMRELSNILMIFQPCDSMITEPVAPFIDKDGG